MNSETKFCSLHGYCAYLVCGTEMRSLCVPCLGEGVETRVSCMSPADREQVKRFVKLHSQPRQLAEDN